MADTAFAVKERSTQKYTATIKDEADAAIAGTSLTTLTLTLYDEETGTILNGRDDQNVLNANNVTVDGAGLLTWTMQPLDNQIVTTALAQERHLALFEWTYAAGAKSGYHEIAFVVINAANRP